MSGKVEPKNRYKIHDGKLYNQAQLEVHYQHSTTQDNISYQHKILTSDDVIVNVVNDDVIMNGNSQDNASYRPPILANDDVTLNVNGQEESVQQPWLMDELGNVPEIKQNAEDVRNERCVGLASFSDQMNQSMDAESSLQESDTGLSYSGAPRVDYKYSSSKVYVATEGLNSTALANYPNSPCTFSTQNLLIQERNNTQAV